MLSASAITTPFDLHQTVNSSHISVSHHTAKQTALNKDSETTYTRSTQSRSELPRNTRNTRNTSSQPKIAQSFLIDSEEITHTKRMPSLHPVAQATTPLERSSQFPHPSPLRTGMKQHGHSPVYHSSKWRLYCRKPQGQR